MKALLALFKRTLIFVLVLGCFAFTWPSATTTNPQSNANTRMLKFTSSSNYTIEYPSTWRSFDRDEGVVLFKNDYKKMGYPLLVNIQTIYTKKAGGAYPNVKTLMDDFYAQVPKMVDQGKFSDRSPFELTTVDGTKLKGEQTFLTFVVNKNTIKQWQIMLVTPDNKIFQTFAYRAPIEVFDANKPIADAMLKSWKLH